jgi:hypothetical protein
MADRVYRTRTIDGLTMPVFIHNGPTFFLHDMPIYADGLVDCWEMVDRDLLREKVRSGWLAPHANDGAQVSVHGLGSWNITRGAWDHGPDALALAIDARLRELNPQLENLHDCHGRTTQKIGNVNVSILGMPRARAVRLVGPERAIPTRIEGDAMWIALREGSKYRICRLRVFADGVIEVGCSPEPRVVDLAALRRDMDAGVLVGSIPKKARVFVHELGSFEIEEEHWAVDPKDQLGEVSDLIDKLNGRPDSIDRCRRAYEQYVKDPTFEHRDALRDAYEAVPEHMRRYVGDMDVKDVAVRMIIYGDEELEGWSHRIVARVQGESKLPTITVPKPKR